MNRILLLTASMLMSVWVSAQTSFFVHQKNGNTVEYLISEVDSITFSNQENSGGGDSEVVDFYCPSKATEIAKNMRLGINIGNTFEVCGDWLSPTQSCETGWGSPVITKEMVEMYKKAGFTAIRIPTAWNFYASANNGKIPEWWIERIKTIVDYCFELDLYAIVNIHWDMGWLEEHVEQSSLSSVNATQKSLWEQIAAAFKEYDERLIFASANEPGRDADDGSDRRRDFTALKTYHQTFVDAVRTSGGYNASRCLIIQAMETSAEHCAQHPELLPKDIIEERLMTEFHYYPYTYTLMEDDASWSPAHYFWGEPYHDTYIDGVNRWCNWHTEKTVDQEFSAIAQTYVNKKVPVIMGEFMAMNRDKLTGDNLKKFEECRNYYYNYVVKAAINNGIVPVLWDTPDNLFNRKTLECLHPQALQGLTQGAFEGKFPW